MTGLEGGSAEYIVLCCHGGGSTAHKGSLSVREALAQADSSVCVVSREVSWVGPESWERALEGCLGY